MRSPSQDGRACPLCGGTTFELLHQWEPEHPRNPATIELGFWECACSLAFLHPIPTAEQLPDDGQWWSQSRTKTYRRRALKKVRAALQNIVFGNPRQRLIRQTARIQPHGTLVDIGSGTGELLQEASRVYDSCVGIEPEALAAQTTRARGFRVIEAPLDQAVTETSNFEVATLDAVLEHLLDPIDALSRVNQLLKVGGVVVVKVPKLGGPSHRHHGREWNGFRVGYHLVMFNGGTLTTALETCGFEVIRSPKRDRLLDDILILWGRKTHDLALQVRRAA